MLRIAGSLVGAACLLATGLVFGYPEEESNPPQDNRFVQRGGPPDRPDRRPEFDRGRFGRGGPPGFGPPGFSPPGFGGGERKLVKDYDRDGNGRLNAEERAEARKKIGSDQRGGFDGPRGFGGPGGPGGPRGFGGPGGREPGKPGPRVSQADVKIYPDAPLYDLDVVRTLFLEFENEDWEEELAAFKNTDVEVPVTLTVDGKKYEDVGVHFRGMSSYGMIPAGLKRSLNLSLDFVHDKQRLYGYKTLNLLNCNGDPSMMNTVLFSAIARKHMPAPKANFVRVVINGESWGLYANAQQFNKEFVKENYGSSKGERWKVPGRPGGDGGLAYAGDNVEEYKRRYEIKSGDDEKAWKDLIALCKTLDQTPPDQLVEALKPILDIDEVLWFLALDAALVNEDGYWTRASDYSLYQDKDGRFHVIPHDMNETFHAGGGPGGFGPPGGRPGFGGPGGPPGFGPPNFDGPGGPPPGETRREITHPLRPGGVEEPRDRRTEERGRDFPGRPGFGPERNNRGRGPGGFPGFGPRGGVTLDPLVALDDPSKPLRSKLLAVPELRARYLANVREIAEESLDWITLGPQVAKLRKLIQEDVKADTRKLASYKEFLAATAPNPSEKEQSRHMPLRTFAEKRRDFLLKVVDEKPAKR